MLLQANLACFTNASDELCIELVPLLNAGLTAKAAWGVLFDLPKAGIVVPSGE